MKVIPVSIVLTLGLAISSFGVTYASSEKGENREMSPAHTQHPPHDHHTTDHIKKLDESMRRKREDEEKSH